MLYEVITGISEDITELERTRQELEHTNRELVRARMREGQKLELLGVLAGGIAHDFNNLLSIILGFGEIAMLDLEEKHPAARCIGEILRAGNRAKELVRPAASGSCYARRRPCPYRRLST